MVLVQGIIQLNNNYVDRKYLQNFKKKWKLLPGL